jgi:hypothetical protein
VPENVEPKREILPIPDVTPPGLTTYDAKDPETAFAPIVPLRPPEGAPNVLIVLVDDAGFGCSSVFGGPCNTPTFERLAADGLRYTRFHTTALCAPTGGVADRPQSSFGGDGEHHRDGDVGAGSELFASEYEGAAR